MNEKDREDLLGQNIGVMEHMYVFGSDKGFDEGWYCVGLGLGGDIGD